MKRMLPGPSRRLSEGYPDLGRLAHEHFASHLGAKGDAGPRLRHLLGLLDRLVCVDPPRRMLVVGCGPRPETVRFLREMGHDARGAEPVSSFVEAANEFLGGTYVLEGAAESIPVPDASQDIVFFESVLEHVDSVPASLNELFRVLAPGGVLFVNTTNRYRFHPRGRNGEFRVPFFNWFPALVKESYVHRHLHYDPRLANFTERPAVHWFTYAELCRRGREAGFARFYAPVDLMRPEDRPVRGGALRGRIRGALVRAARASPWFRALVLTQLGDAVFMLKR